MVRSFISTVSVSLTLVQSKNADRRGMEGKMKMQQGTNGRGRAKEKLQ